MSTYNRYMRAFLQAQFLLQSPDPQDRDEGYRWLTTVGIDEAPSMELKLRALSDSMAARAPKEVGMRFASNTDDLPDFSALSDSDDLFSRFDVCFRWRNVAP